jgi:hypothetical protein
MTIIMIKYIALLLLITTVYSQCAVGLYLRSSDNTCQPCGSNCKECIPWPITDSKCIKCFSGGSMVSNLSNCMACSSDVAYVCKTKNLCDMNASCVNCPFILVNDICRQCSKIYYKCSSCNSTQCLHCQK